MTKVPRLPTSRHRFLLNPHIDMRLSRCPNCSKTCYPRKFALLVDIKGWGPMIQGKTCQYCSQCDMIMCHQVDLETELAVSFAKIAPHLIGSDYFIPGTVDLKFFKTQLQRPTGDPFAHFIPFITEMKLDYDPGGWRRDDAPPHIITAAAARERLSTPWKDRSASA